ncbi:MAG: asparagine synthase (glutamine-hydrolyzing) [Bryobacteraceae bacterium]
MCGIVGFTHHNTAPDPAALRRAAAAIHHRGPDQQGFHETETVSLAAVRLKILDLASGDQPIHFAGHTIVFNGEVYNFRELRAELESLGHGFVTSSDTEVVLHAFAEWGRESLSRLNGMFAFAVWSEPERRLTIVRDRLGIKPVYWMRRGADLHFGSELKALFAHPSVPRTLDRQALPLYLSLNYLPQPFTLVEGVEKLAPGSWLEWKDGAVTTGAYWCLRFAPDPAIGFEDAKHELDSLLDCSIRDHLLSDVPLGLWLSGGLDSSTIAYYATRHVPGKLKTFSVSFHGRGFDEAPYFRRVAQAFGTDHYELDLSAQQDLEGAIEQLACHADEPSADAGALPVYFLSKMTRGQVTVALSGEGADELFGGYQTYLADRYARLARLFPAAIRRGMAACAELLPASDEKIGFEYKLKRFLAGSRLPPARAHLFWNGAAPAADFTAELDRLFAPLPAASGYLNQFLYLDQRCYLPDDILNKSDRMSMAHSLEVRPPFLDHRIVEFAARLPESYKIQGGVLKRLLRELMRGRLPPAVLHRPKEGFDIPAHHWFRTTLRPMLLDTLNERAVNDAGIFPWPEIEALQAAHQSRTLNAGYRLWGLLILFLWIKRWNIVTR